MNLFFPNNVPGSPNALELKPQSPYLYLQSAGSDGSDGSAPGIHLRWDLLRNLGESHLPKGNAASTTVNFNRSDDFVFIWRSPYNNRYPTVVDFNVPPDNFFDNQQLWVYLNTNTGKKVYIWFRNAAQYASVRNSIHPTSNPLQFVKQYGAHLIEAEMPEDLFFAAEFTAANIINNPELRVEAISVVENLPISDKFVSCRQKFVDENWCVPSPGAGGGGGQSSSTTANVAEEKTKLTPDASAPVPACCGKETNLLQNGSFSSGNVDFFSDYRYAQPPNPGYYYIVTDANQHHSSWVGTPYHGDTFMVIDGHKVANQVMWGQQVAVTPKTDYCFSGRICNLQQGGGAVLIKIDIEDGNGNLIKTANYDGPAAVSTWEEFSVEFNSGQNSKIVIKIYSRRIDSYGNDIGLDYLYLCEAAKCGPRIMSENIRSVRFLMENGFIGKLELETYADYMDKANWTQLNDKYSLTMDTSTALRWLEDTNYQINNLWPKFNDGARVNVGNYQDRWSVSNGVKDGVDRYIALSNTDPQAIDTLSGQTSVDGSIQVSMLSMLQLVALDFHVARMLGLGTIDRQANTSYIYVASYETKGALDDTNVARGVGHAYMTLPTAPTDYRLPEQPKLLPIEYGLFVDNGLANPSPLTDVNGYTPDGKTRFLSLFLEQDDPNPTLGPFFQPNTIFCSQQHTASVFFGMEYKKQGESAWRKPEIAHDDTYVDTSSPAYPETMPIANHGEQDKAILVHAETESGVHLYAPYGVNWFSRPSPIGNIRSTNASVFIKANTLLPPSNFAVQLIQEESPLMLTTAAEQNRLGTLTSTDKTLVRVTFDYFHTHDINYDYGDQVELFFRQDDPGNVMGQIKSVAPLGTDLAIVRTESYTQNSTGVTISPTLAASQMGNYVGGILTSASRNFVIDAVMASAVSGEGPIFHVRKIEENTAVDPGTGQFVTMTNHISPDAGNTFMAVENMADEGSWPNTNPLGKVVNLLTGTNTTETYTEDGETITRQLRGIWQNATIADELDGYGNVIGVYQIDFPGFTMASHPQSSDPDPVEWYRGVVRVAKASDPLGRKKVLEVIKIENIGTANPLRIYAADATYDAGDPILTGGGVSVNYYPGYRVYLHVDTPHGLTEANTLPTGGDLYRKTWMAARSKDSGAGYDSALSMPAPLIAMGYIDPLPPEAPNGGQYATRPDFYFKSTWTFSVQFAHEPFAAAFYRATEDRILKALYTDATVASIKSQLATLGDGDPYRFDRWRNLISFDYVYNDPGKPFYDATGSNSNGTFRRFPREIGNFRFPKPDNPDYFTGSDEPGAVLAKVKEAVYTAFTPLTEQPLLYQYIKGGSYQPIPKPQTIRDQDGNLMDPSDPDFDQAPMAKKLGGNQIQFTDFGLDGASNMLYFYLGRELGSRGKLSSPSPISGPIALINTRPPEIPGIKRVYVVPATGQGSGPRVEFEVNGYPVEQKVRQLKIYRTTSATEALSIRSMELVKTIDLVAEGIDKDLVYKVQDDFESGFVPYGETLYYRVIGLREVTNAQDQTEWAPSKPSKLVLTMVADVLNPKAPTLRYTASPIGGNPAQVSGVSLEWDTTTYNGKYYLEKMNASGVWKTIYTVSTNATTVPPVDLTTTDLASNVLIKEGDNGRPRYHLFRVRVENSSGLFNLVEKELTI